VERTVANCPVGLVSDPGLNVPVAVSQQFGVSAGQTDVFLVDNTGMLDVFSVQGGGSWTTKPVPLSKPNTFLQGSYLAASQQIGLNQTDVFGVDADGNLDVYYVDGGGTNWQVTEGINNGTPLQAGYPVAASAQFGAYDQTDLFVSTGGYGDAYAYSVVGTGKWQGPLTLIP
jgi:hypothetical protein